MAKKALGKGLQALLPAGKSQGTLSAQEVQMLSIEKIVPNRYQPRILFKDSELDELTASIKENGILQPVLVRRTGDGMYELIAGERRWRAAKTAGLSVIPGLIRSSSDEKSIAIALVENLQRQNLNPMEEAYAYSRLMKEFKFTQEEVAQSVGKDRSSVANILRLTSLPKEIQGLIESGQFTLGHAKVVAGLPDQETQIIVARRIIKDQLSVRQIEHMVAELKKPASRHPFEKTKREYRNLEDQLRKRLGAKVTIKNGRRGGHMTIHFFSDEDRDRILGIILE